MKINRNNIPNIIGENVDIEENSLVYSGVKIGTNSRVLFFSNLYGCEIGENCMIGSYVEIQAGVKIGDNSRIQSHSFICEGIEIGNNVFIGHGVMFINHKKPHTTDSVLLPNETKEEWLKRIHIVGSKIEDDVSIGSNATIMGGITIGKGAMIGAGAVVTKSVPAGETWVGNSARKLEK